VLVVAWLGIDSLNLISNYREHAFSGIGAESFTAGAAAYFPAAIFKTTYLSSLQCRRNILRILIDIDFSSNHALPNITPHRAVPGRLRLRGCGDFSRDGQL
jgi:hypothetical protein